LYLCPVLTVIFKFKKIHVLILLLSLHLVGIITIYNYLKINYIFITDTVQTNILKLLYEQSIETNAYLKRLDGKMDRLEQTIKNMSGTQNNNNYAIDNSFLSIFPLKDIDSLKDFDIRITNDPDFKLNVVKILNIFNFVLSICISYNMLVNMLKEKKVSLVTYYLYYIY